MPRIFGVFAITTKSKYLVVRSEIATGFEENRSGSLGPFGDEIRAAQDRFPREDASKKKNGDSTSEFRSCLFFLLLYCYTPEETEKDKKKRQR